MVGNMRIQFLRLGLPFALLLTLLTFSTPNIILERWTADEVRPSSANIESHYSPHDPIVITSNQDFVNQGWAGNGSESNPYLIQDLSIASDETCISISTTDVHFKIDNCTFTHDTWQGGSKGVFLKTINNGVIGFPMYYSRTIHSITNSMECSLRIQ
jgi:hypothetical protein